MCPETHKNEPQSHVFALSILPLVSILHQTRGVRKATYEKRFYGQYGVRVPNDNPLPTTTSRLSHFWPEKWPPISAKSACRTRPNTYVFAAFGRLLPHFSFRAKVRFDPLVSPV